ncbi:hypothetical protein ACF1BP_36275 [Streptomyces sp. NPDC014735]|uniref:hypothetical protein n=1 Tax=unclassified Streptomyces TaxID=2593676 RepID=UPI0037007898
MRFKSTLVAVGAALAVATTAVPAQAAAAMSPGTTAAVSSICYTDDVYVKNQYGQNGAYAKTGWCLRGDGYFETTTGWNSVKDLVSGDGVAARLWVWGQYQDGTNFKTLRATDTTATSGATTWGFSGYLNHMSIWVCLGTAAPGTTNSNCQDMRPPIFWP